MYPMNPGQNRKREHKKRQTNSIEVLESAYMNALQVWADHPFQTEVSMVDWMVGRLLFSKNGGKICEPKGFVQYCL